MAVNYNDKRLVEVKSEEENALNKSNTMYNSMIADSQQYYDKQIQASKDWADKQSQLQQEQTDFAIEKVEQQKEQANKDYIREQSGAYVDWQKESNRYGANAETMASSGFVASGYGESAQVSMFNTYQNRVATARESYNRAILNYDNAIKDAQLQNSSILAEIAYNALQKQLELSLQGFQYKNQLLETQANKQLELKNFYHNKYQDVLNQINTENALAEQIRQFNAQLAEEKRQFNASMSARSSGGSGGSSGGSSGNYSSSKASGGSSGSKGVVAGAMLGAKAGTGNEYEEIKVIQQTGIVNTQMSAKKYGTFSNGYQPKGIYPLGVLKKTGDKISVTTSSGKKQTQNVWYAPDGSRWIWQGATQNGKKTGVYKQVG